MLGEFPGSATGQLRQDRRNIDGLVLMPKRIGRSIALATACGVHAIQDGLYATVYVLLPVIAPVFGLSYVQVGSVRAAFSAAMTLLQIPSGVLAERFGERILLAFGLACAGLGFLAVATSSGVATLLCGVFLAGLGAAFQHAPSSSLIVRLFEHGGQRAALGAYNSSGDVGKLAFTAAFSLALGIGLAWHRTIAGFGFLALASAFAVFVALRHLDVGGPGAGTSDRAGTTGWGVRDRSGFATLAVIVFLDLAVQSGFLTFVAFLMTVKQVPTSLAAIAVVLTLTGGVFGKFGCGFLTEWIGARRSLVAVQCMTASGIVAVVAAPPMISFVMLPFLGVVLQGSSTITYGSVSDLIDRERQSRGFAFIYSVSSAAAIIGPIAFGTIGDRFGLPPAMLAMAVAASLTVLLSVLLPTRAPKTA
jgi:MFS family permease